MREGSRRSGSAVGRLDLDVVQHLLMMFSSLHIHYMWSYLNEGGLLPLWQRCIGRLELDVIQHLLRLQQVRPE